MPLPASEEPYFLYSFGNTSYVDLLPGMELKLERPLKNGGNRGHRSVISMEAVYRVVVSSGGNVALRHLSSKGKKKISGEQSKKLFELAKLFHGKLVLRVFLAMAGDKNMLPAIVSGTRTPAAMQALTETILKSDRSCPKSGTADEICLVFDGTAVNLFSSIRINGKEELLPFGTSLGQIFDVNARGSSLETLSIKRQLATGDYAEIRFPRTPDSLRQIVLLPGDEVDWLVEKRRPADR
jgi:hypothetical protein